MKIKIKKRKGKKMYKELKEKANIKGYNVDIILAEEYID